jgi:hypothetical protein
MRCVPLGGEMTVAYTAADRHPMLHHLEPLTVQLCVARMIGADVDAKAPAAVANLRPKAVD